MICHPPLLFRPLILLFLAGAWLPGLAAQEPTADRLARLEATVERLSTDVEILRGDRTELEVEVQTLRGDLSAARGEAASEAQTRALEERVRAVVTTLDVERRERAVRIGGYFDTAFRSDGAGRVNDTFDQHRLILKLDVRMQPFLVWRSEIEIEGGGVGASHLTGNEIVVEFAEGHVLLHEAANLKVGALLVPFNRYNEMHDSPLQDLTDRPLVDRRIVPTTWTEAGFGVYGAFHTDPVSIDYDVVLVNGLTGMISASGGTRAARGSLRKDNNENKMLIGRLGITPDLGFLDAANFGTSLATGKYDDAGQQWLTMWGFDWTVKQGPFELVGEYARAWLDRGAPEIAAGVPPGMEGWYIEGRLHFFPDGWRQALPIFTESSTFTLVARYGQADTDTSGTAVDFAARGDAYRDDRTRLTVGLNFRPVEKTVFKFEYQWFFEPAGIPDLDNNRLVVSFATYF